VQRTDDALAEHWAKFEAFKAQQLQDAIDMRLEAAALVSAEQLQDLDRQAAARHPGAMQADFWNNRLAELRGISPLQQFNERANRRTP